jgi:hypothetical protein
MAIIIARHRVGDFYTWIQAHGERAEVIGLASSGFEIFQDVDDPNSIVLVIETDDPEKLAAVMSDPEHADIKASHTVIEPIIVSAEVQVLQARQDP